jgi:hypothetical protein
MSVTDFEKIPVMCQGPLSCRGSTYLAFDQGAFALQLSLQLFLARQGKAIARGEQLLEGGHYGRPTILELKGQTQLTAVPGVIVDWDEMLAGISYGSLATDRGWSRDELYDRGRAR